ncbi:MAG: hypothetical protein RSC00_09885, partial [Ruthenibacterium sp.]
TLTLFTACEAAITPPAGREWKAAQMLAAQGGIRRKYFFAPTGGTAHKRIHFDCFGIAFKVLKKF